MASIVFNYSLNNQWALQRDNYCNNLIGITVNWISIYKNFPRPTGMEFSNFISLSASLIIKGPYMSNT